MSCGAEITANRLHTSLIGNEDFTVPSVDFSDNRFKLPDATDLYKAVVRLSNDDLTTREVDGSGSFDFLMTAVKAHLAHEHRANRITGAEYTKAYIALVEAAMTNSVQFVLNKEQHFWQGQTAQIQALTSLVDMEMAKVKYAGLKFDALNSKAGYALTKIKLANEDQQYCISKFQVDHLLPAQRDLTLAQKDQQIADTNISKYQLTTFLPAQVAGINKETEGKEIANQSATYNLTNILPRQGQMLDAERAQVEAKTALDVYQRTTYLPKQLELMAVDKEIKVLEKDIINFKVTKMLPAERDILLAQKELETARVATEQAQAAKMAFEVSTYLPAQIRHLEAQIAVQQAELAQKEYYNQQILPVQKLQMEEQANAYRAQTSDTRLDGAGVAGSTKSEKDLREQQIESYKQDAATKVAKLIVDSWITNRTMAEIEPYSGADNGGVSATMGALKSKVGL